MGVRCSAFLATSLDGFIAREDGGLDWLDRANALVPPGEDCGYAAFMASVDALVMGRHTFEKVLSFPEWPYGDKPVWVLSRTLQAIPPGLPPLVRLLNAAPAEVVALAAQQGWTRLYVDGGQTVQAFLAAACLTDLTLTTIPVLLGRGRRLFGDVEHDVALTHVSTQTYPFGFVQSRYELVPLG
jgi:dihydrofolate reductase